jgi:uncharacterized protein YwgA
MKRLQRAALLTELIAQMRDKDSWCGETHVQKATYMLQDLLGVELGYDFTLYKHGPFSFDFRDELGELVSDGLIRYVPQMPPYGPRIAVQDDAAERIREMYPKTLARHRDKIEFVAEKLDARGVVDLERLATALYVTNNAPNAPAEERARMLSLLKPHVPEPAALHAVQELDEIRGEAADIAA